MKILHTADWHLGKRLNEYSRIEEQRQVLDEICAIADAEGVDAVVIAGDLYDNFNPANDAVELFYKTVHRLSKNGKRAVIAIAGNHDSADRIDAPHPLAKECGIIFNGRPFSEIIPFKLDCGFEIIRSAPGFIEMKLPEMDYPLRLILTPYANEASMKQYLGTEDREEELRQILEKKWLQLANQYCDHRGVNILVAHLFFMQKGGPIPEEPEDEKPILHIGGAQAIFTENVPDQIQYVALGHLHRFQMLGKDPCPVVYSSSPLAYSLSEASQQKYVIVLDAEPGKSVKFTPIKLQSGKRLERKRFLNIEEALTWLHENQETYVEIKLVTENYIDAKVKRALYQAHDGILAIIPERLNDNNTIEEGINTVDLNKDIKDLFKDYFKHRIGQEPNDDIIGLLNEILNIEEQ
ncbi:MAG: exonuclease subunit SbcD [Bacteroidota bacterium]|nr:exonuclease subunit SbcD [Bacteroidota bacterium]